MANAPEFLADIPGASELLECFGFWPTFHDGEVLSVHLDRAGPSRLRVHTWAIETTSVNSQRTYLWKHIWKHIIVTFILEDISELELDGFNHQNVVAGLILTKDPNGYKLKLEPCFGLSGTIAAGSVRIELEPGKPPNR
jgi:hypothetical protein